MRRAFRIAARPPRRNRLNWIDGLLLGIGIALALFVLVMPLVLVFVEALADGWHAIASNLLERDMRHAIALTLLVTLLVVPVNLAFGLLLAWCVVHYRFRGRLLLTRLIDVPFAMSPVVAGLCYLLLYGSQSPIGRWLAAQEIQVMFAWPGIVLATLFITCPYVARYLIPLMEELGDDEELAALTLGANGWQIFRHITLPKIRWGLLYGTTLTAARAAGEFGAVSVVSGTIRGQTLTLPLHIELLHQDYNSVGAFTAAALLTLLALLTLALRAWLERRIDLTKD